MTTSPLIGKLQDATGGSKHLLRLSALVLAVIASILIWVVVDPIGGGDLIAKGVGADKATDIGPGEIFFAFLSWGIGAWIVLMLIERFSSNAPKFWLNIALLALVASFVPIFTGAENTATTISFIAMHLLSAGIIIPVFLASLQPRH